MAEALSRLIPNADSCVISVIRHRQARREEWWSNLTAFLEIIARATETERTSFEFQRKLWEQNPVSAVGQGFISVDKAIEDEAVREWIASTSLEQLPENPDEAAARLAEVADQMVERLRPYCRQIPYLKIFRVLTAFFPQHFTTIADRGKLRDLHLAMFESMGEPWPPQFGTSASHAVKRHANVLARLAEALGPVSDDTAGLVRRITFPWFLYEKLQAGFREPSFHQVDPGTVGGREVEMKTWTFGEPFPDDGGFVGSVVVHNDLHIEFGGYLHFDLIQELAKFQRAMAVVQLRQSPAGLQFQRGEQRSRAMAFVVMRVALQLPRPYRQQWLGAVQRLNGSVVGEKARVFIIPSRCLPAAREVRGDDASPHGHPRFWD